MPVKSELMIGYARPSSRRGFTTIVTRAEMTGGKRAARSRLQILLETDRIFLSWKL
jgi:hypothetical protein